METFTPNRIPQTGRAAKRILKINIVHRIDEYPDTSYLGTYSNTRKTEFAIDCRHKPGCFLGTPLAQEGYDKLESVYQYLYCERVTMQNFDRQVNALDPWYPGVSAAEDKINTLMESYHECDCPYLNVRSYRYFNSAKVEPFDPQAPWIPTTVAPADREAYWRKAMQDNAMADYERMEAYNNDEWSYIGIRAEAEIAVGDLTQIIRSGGLWGIESDSDESFLEEIEQDQLTELRQILYDLGFSKRAIAAAVKTLTKGGQK